MHFFYMDQTSRVEICVHLSLTNLLIHSATNMKVNSYLILNEVAWNDLKAKVNIAQFKNINMFYLVECAKITPSQCMKMINRYRKHLIDF